MKKTITTPPAALILVAACLSGCIGPATPASRATSAQYRDIYTYKSPGAKITVGDAAFQSADGTGSTATATPTLTPTITTTLTLPTGGVGLLDAAATKGVNKLLDNKKVTPEEAAAIKDCADGNCSD